MDNGVGKDSAKSQSADDANNDAAAMHVRERMERLRNDFANQIDDTFDGIVSDMMDNLELRNKFASKNALRLDDSEKLYADKRKLPETGVLPKKQFLRRNSVLTDLYEIKHFKTIYNIFIVILILISLNAIIYDLMHTGTSHVGLRLIIQGFGKFSIVIEIWLVMLASTFSVYGICSYWARRRITLKSYKLKIWDYAWLALFVVYQLALIIVPVTVISWAGLPPMSRVVVLTETVRLVMKMHAFVRSTAAPVLSWKPHTEDKESVSFPGFSKFLYFIFAPTLIYQDSYPRTKEIRWRLALRHFFDVILVIFNMAFVFERLLIPPFEDFGKRPFDLRSFILTVYGTTFPGILIFLSGFYCLLHAWMNAAAEVMRFGDRLFYKDWWNSTSYSSFYRCWNVVVHDWLYTYVYKDMYENVVPGNRFLATIAVFSASSIFHEYILAFTFGFLFPFMLLMFGVIGFLLVFVQRTKHFWGNLFLWFSLSFGSGLLISFYSVEYFARVNCPPYDDEILDFIFPRSFRCYNISS